MSDYDARRNTIVQQFLQHAIVIDDRAYEKDRTDSDHDLETEEVVKSFIEKGIICAAISPQPNTEENEEDELDADQEAPTLDSEYLKQIVRAVRRADIVVLDWQMKNDNGAAALSIMEDMLNEERDERLRFIAIYTGESDVEKIGAEIKERMQSSHRHFESIDNDECTLSWGHCYIYIYAKNTKASRDDRFVSASSLANKLIEDFTNITEGILPGVALMALSAIRSNAHKVLDRFTNDLDPAYIAHYTCLTSPDEAEGHMIAQIIGELHAIIDDAAEGQQIARQKGVYSWLDRKVEQNGGSDAKFKFGRVEMNIDQAKQLVDNGFDQYVDLKIPPQLGEKAWRDLSSGFAISNNNLGNELDNKLAWMMNFRTIYDTNDRILHLGTVLKRAHDSKIYICMRPKCDSIRLDERYHPFLLLPLISPKDGRIRLIIKTDKDKYKELCIETYMSEWVMVEFKSQGDGCVKAREDSTGDFNFFGRLDNSRRKFQWLGEMKPEFAQRVAQHFAEKLERIATNNLEWLRRKEKGV